MPIFEYKCGDCGSKFDLLISNSNKNDVQCPECSSTKVEKQLSLFNTGGKRSAAAPIKCDTCSISGG
ncbi:hypothetical protein ASZ90_017804 [hydrocarbon metagenome]|uniref:Putative regulatory protein FmdB zinc ribbon domain-containing protein n=1 Tax=hydrocarbon metagenome TaxID=938273 RepID=A0A0W8E809_9ZZZZ